MPLTPNISDRIDEILPGLFPPLCAVSAKEDLPPQASNRSYHRLLLKGDNAPSSLIVMVLPPDPFLSEESDDGGPPTELPFVTMQRFLRSRGLPVPEVYGDFTAEGFLLLEDLGTQTMLNKIQHHSSLEETQKCYEKAVDLLVAFQNATQEPAENVAYSRGFDDALLIDELHHFEEWLLQEWAGVFLPRAEEELLHQQFEEIVAGLKRYPYRLAHRDFQSTNLLTRGEGYVLIDFQDALMGPAVYDLVALLRDSYVELPYGMVEELALRFYEARAAELAMSLDEFMAFFHLQTLQRKLKDAGRFIFIDRVKGNPNFLPFVPATLRYVKDALVRLPNAAPLASLIGPVFER